MKDIKKTLEEKQKEVTKQFDELEKKRQTLNSALAEITTEMTRLQGENRMLVKLLEDFQEVTTKDIK